LTWPLEIRILKFPSSDGGCRIVAPVGRRVRGRNRDPVP
jgi:hypothetical protein